MTKDNDISSTDKLLSLIRSKKDIYDDSGPENTAELDPFEIEEDLNFVDLDIDSAIPAEQDIPKSKRLQDSNSKETTKQKSKVLTGSDNRTPSPESTEKKQSFIDKLKKQSFWPGKNNDVIAVDLGRKSIKMIRIGDIHGDKRVMDARIINLDVSADPEKPQYIAAVKKALDNFTEGLSRPKIWSLVSSTKAEIWSIKVPPVKNGLANAIYWTAKKEKPFDDKEQIFDYRVTGMVQDSNVQKYLVSVYTVQKKEKKSVENIFNRAGYRLEGLTISTFAFQNLFQNKIIPLEKNNFAVLFIDDESTRIDIFENNSLRLSRLIKTGLDSMLESIAYENSRQKEPGILTVESSDESMDEQGPSQEEMDKAYAEICSMFSDSENNEAQDCFEHIAPVLRRLSQQAERTLDHYVNVLNNSPVRKVFLAGKAAGISGIIQFVKEQLAVDVEILDPLHPSLSLHSSKISLSRQQRIELVMATGAAVSDNAHTANLLFTAKDHERKKIADIVSRITAVACMLMVIATAGYSLIQKMEVKSLSSQAQTLETQLKKFDPPLSIDYIFEVVDELEDTGLVLRKSVKKNIPVGVISELSRLTPDSIKILNLLYKPDNESKEAVSGFVTLEGIVVGDPEMFETYLSGYLRNLGYSDLFADSSVHNSYKDSLYGEGDVYRFVLNINLPRAT